MPVFLKNLMLTIAVSTNLEKDEGFPHEYELVFLFTPFHWSLGLFRSVVGRAVYVGPFALQVWYPADLD